jgi:hypothetical protein
VGIAVGGVLLLTSHRTEAPAPVPAAAGIMPWVGIGTAGLGGTFE